ncbi:MAG: hypothetical protein ACYTEQ_30230 [Planctomycetota bacterium]|jgi:hypothetical protein
MNGWRRNAIRIWTYLDGEWVSNFSLYEFESKRTGIVVIHPSVPLSAEFMRRDLSDAYGCEVGIFITSGSRTDEDSRILAEGDPAAGIPGLGWIDEGGAVSRDSRHLIRNGACAIDFEARLKRHRHSWESDSWSPVIPPEEVALFARQRFDFVKTYARHTHVDNRDGGLKVWRYRSEGQQTSPTPL